MAFTRRVLAGLLTIVTVVLGLSLTVAGPAAADVGVWKPYGNTNPITSSPSTWRCGSTVKIATDVGAQVCVIRSPSGGAIQSAVIVRNDRSSLFAAEASMHLRNENDEALGYHWACQQSGVAKNSWSVCYGDTLARRDLVLAWGHANNQSLRHSPLI